MQPPPTNQNRNPVLFSNTTSDSCHHPGYQGLVHQSWWCDHCLDDCHRLQEMQVESDSRWYDFFIWLCDLIIKAAAITLSALFCIIAYFMGKVDRSNQTLSALSQELEALKREREEILDFIDQLKTERGKASFDREFPSAHQIDKALYTCSSRLDALADEIHSLERDIARRQAENQIENLLAAQTKLHGEHH